MRLVFHVTRDSGEDGVPLPDFLLANLWLPGLLQGQAAGCFHQFVRALNFYNAVAPAVAAPVFLTIGLLKFVARHFRGHPAAPAVTPLPPDAFYDHFLRQNAYYIFSARSSYTSVFYHDFVPQHNTQAHHSVRFMRDLIITVFEKDGKVTAMIFLTEGSNLTSHWWYFQQFLESFPDGALKDVWFFESQATPLRVNAEELLGFFQHANFVGSDETVQFAYRLMVKRWQETGRSLLFPAAFAVLCEVGAWQ